MRHLQGDHPPPPIQYISDLSKVRHQVRLTRLCVISVSRQMTVQDSETFLLREVLRLKPILSQPHTFTLLKFVSSSLCLWKHCLEGFVLSPKAFVRIGLLKSFFKFCHKTFYPCNLSKRLEIGRKECFHKLPLSAYTMHTTPGPGSQSPFIQRGNLWVLDTGWNVCGDRACTKR